MPFLVIKCTSCGKFQVKQQVKANKFSCAVCGQKQPLQRVYAISDTAKQCRLKVQELSIRFGEAKEAKEAEECARTEQLEQAYAAAEGQGLQPEWGPECLPQEQQQADRAYSRWLAFAAAAEQVEGDQLQAEEEDEEDPHFVTRVDAPAPGSGRVGGGGRQRAMSRASDRGEESRPSIRAAAKGDNKDGESCSNWGRGQKRERAQQEAWDEGSTRQRQGQQPQRPPLLPPSSLQPPCFQQQQHLILRQLPYPTPHQARIACADATNYVLAPPPQHHQGPLASIPARSNAGQVAPRSASSCTAAKWMPQATTAWGGRHGEQGGEQGMVNGGVAGVWQPWPGGRAQVQGAGLAGSGAPQAMRASAAFVGGKEGNNEGVVRVGVGRNAGAQGVGALGGLAQARGSGGRGVAASKWGDFLDGSDDIENGGREDEEEEEEGGFVTAL